MADEAAQQARAEALRQARMDQLLREADARHAAREAGMVCRNKAEERRAQRIAYNAGYSQGFQDGKHSAAAKAAMAPRSRDLPPRPGGSGSQPGKSKPTGGSTSWGTKDRSKK